MSSTGSPRGGPLAADYATLLAAHTAAEPGPLFTPATEAEQAHEEQMSSAQQEWSAAAAEKPGVAWAAQESSESGIEGNTGGLLATLAPIGLAIETGPAAATSARPSSLAVAEHSPPQPAAEDRQEGPAFLRIVRVDEQEQLQQTMVEFKSR